MLNELLRESSVIADWLDEGRAEGLRVGARLAVAGRFGPLDERLQATIARADEAALEAVLAHIGSDTRKEILSRLDVAGADS